METSVWKQNASRVYASALLWLKKLVFLFPPMIVFFVTLLMFKANALYPFGTKTLSWCDMDQQVVPLLIDFKDILSGKEGFFFSFKNAGGMNFYGVFFFFLSSPFSFLVAFVDKSNVSLFANILILLKMCAISCTASLYFQKRYRENPLLNVFLSVLYAYSGYTMLYYQNVIWLDIVYLFPLLMLGLEQLKEGKKVLFTCVLAACVVVNYYLSYMVVVFLLLYAFTWLILTKDKGFAGNFCLCCAVAALLSAVVWLSSLLQYFSSGRTTSILDNLRSSSIFTSYKTTFPTVFSILFLFPFALIKKEKCEKDNRLRRVLFLATLVPIVLEPINKMWQTGSYMSFPTRYAFITIFLCLTLAMDGMSTPKTKVEKNLSLKQKFLQNWKNELPRYALSVFSLLIAAWYFSFSKAYTAKNVETMDQYSHSLWGNEASFEALLKLYAVALLVGAILYVLWRLHLLKPVFLWLSVSIMVVSELYVAPMTYMLTPAHDVEWYQDVMELADVIEDDGFYRVKSDKEYSSRDFDANLMGSLGYNALGHYTSLTSDKYMTAIKQFGYTSYWMEVGNSGGTLLTDALLSVKYQIKSKMDGEAVYKGEYFQIDELDHSLPLGVIARRDIVDAADTTDYTRRADMQKILYEDFFGENEAVKSYGIESAALVNLTVTEESGKFVLRPEGTKGKLVFKIPVSGTETFYFNAFDENTNALNQKINKKFTVSTSKLTISEYPTQKRNGLLPLGEYSSASEDKETTVMVTVSVGETVAVRDLGVIAIDGEVLGKEIEQAKTVGLEAGKNSLTGSYTAQGGECVFLSIAYDEGMKLKINGKKAELYEVYNGFTAFYLTEGVNEIAITYKPKGFVFGALLSFVGLGLCGVAVVLWIRKKQSVELPKAVQTVAFCGLIVAGLAVAFVVYMLPLLLCAVG